MRAGGAAVGRRLVAIQGLFVGAVETIKRAAGLLVALVVGRLAFEEHVGPARIAGALLMGIGTALIISG